VFLKNHSVQFDNENSIFSYLFLKMSITRVSFNFFLKKEKYKKALNILHYIPPILLIDHTWKMLSLCYAKKKESKKRRSNEVLEKRYIRKWCASKTTKPLNRLYENGRKILPKYSSQATPCKK
jgi:hypothetical protein